MTLDDVLTLFGTPEAKERFLQLCRLYYGERVRQEVGNETGHPAMNSRRAQLHTEIMRIIQKLYLRRQEPMPSRKDVGKMIMQYVRNESDKQESNHHVKE